MNSQALALSLCVHAAAVAAAWTLSAGYRGSPHDGDSFRVALQEPVALLSPAPDNPPAPETPEPPQPPPPTEPKPPEIPEAAAAIIARAREDSPTTIPLATAPPAPPAPARPDKNRPRSRRDSSAAQSGSNPRSGALLPPSYLRAPAPPYPPAARKAHREGTVVLQVTVSADGRAEKVVVSRSSGSPDLDEAAIAAVRTWTFRPAEVNGQRVGTTVEVPVAFRLK